MNLANVTNKRDLVDIISSPPLPQFSAEYNLAGIHDSNTGRYAQKILYGILRLKQSLSDYLKSSLYYLKNISLPKVDRTDLLLSLILLGASVNAVGCTRPYTKREQLLFGAFVGTQIVDAVITDRALSTGNFKEGGLLYDDNSSSGEIVIIKALAVGAVYGLTQIFPDDTENILKTATIIGGAGAGFTAYQYEKGK